MPTKILTTKALDNHGYSYTVTLIHPDRCDFEDIGDWILRITAPRVAGT